MIASPCALTAQSLCTVAAPTSFSVGNGVVPAFLDFRGLSATAASTECLRVGGNLVAGETLRAYGVAHQASLDAGMIWLGGSRLGNSPDFAWNTGTPIPP